MLYYVGLFSRCSRATSLYMHTPVTMKKPQRLGKCSSGLHGTQMLCTSSVNETS